MPAENRDLPKVIVTETLQQVLEAEMDEALQASKTERTARRLGYRYGYYTAPGATPCGHHQPRIDVFRRPQYMTFLFCPPHNFLLCLHRTRDTWFVKFSRFFHRAEQQT